MEFQRNAKMYEGAPWCLGRYDSFEVNQPQLITLLNHDYVIWKDEDGVLNALDNICPHAGANLAQGGYIVDFQGKSCLACPYHGNKVQFFGNGQVVIDNNISSQAIQQTLPLQIVDGLVWTYGLKWQENEGKLIATAITPKLPIPDFSNIPLPIESSSKFILKELNHIYSRSESVDCHINQAIWNIHDGEHFAGTHRDTMLTKEIEIKNLIQDDNKISWQLVQHKRNDPDVKKNKMNPLVDKLLVQHFNVFLPSIFIVPLALNKKQLVLGVVTMYPQSLSKTRICLDSYINFEFAWWQKLLNLPKMVNDFRDQLILEDKTILDNLYPNFDKKITLKNDTPAVLAMNYLENWS